MCTSRSTYHSWLCIGVHEQLTRVHPVCWHPYCSSGSNAYLNCASPWLCITYSDLSHQGESLAASAVGRNGLFSCQGSIAIIAWMAAGCQGGCAALLVGTVPNRQLSLFSCRLASSLLVEVSRLSSPFQGESRYSQHQRRVWSDGSNG